MDKLKSPYYIVYEDKIRNNLKLIKEVSARSGAEIIMAFKANALWKTFHIFREFGVKSTASSLNEMMLANDELHSLAHTYCPAYTDGTIDKYIEGSSHITFNSLHQFNRFYSRVNQYNLSGNHTVSCGLRINPEVSVVDTDIYNPCIKGSRFGVIIDEMPETLPDGIEGFHFHALCESTSYDLEKVLEAVESKFGKYLDSLKWINMGGGHLMTRKGYNIDLLVKTLNDFKLRYPNIEVILEPGSAFTWQTGNLVTSVLDIVENDGIRTAIIDASFACHMPDTLEMPYQPGILESCQPSVTSIPYRLGGNSCLSGDFCGPWHFEKALVPGQKLTLLDMNHYTTVKTTMFNGISHPDIVLCRSNGECEYLRRFTYEDYRSRMS